MTPKEAFKLILDEAIGFYDDYGYNKDKDYEKAIQILKQFFDVEEKK